jgi:hypothetical protein
VDGLRRCRATALFIGSAIAVQAASLTGCERITGGVAMAPGTPGDQVLSNPAKAVLLKYLPARADDRAFLYLVDAALRSGRGQKIAADGATNLGELDAIRDEITARGLPLAFVGIPMWESYLDTEAVSRSCAAGAWQLMPETAVELGLEVADCRIGDRLWTPSPDRVASPESPYRFPDGSCGISTCAVDERVDLARSTMAALDLLEQYYNAQDVARNPDRAALTVLAYNTGLGSTRSMVNQVGDPFEALDACVTEGCRHMGKVAAEYVPGTIAAAALSTCGAAQVSESPFTPEAKSGMCRSLEEASLLPGSEPIVADAD